MSVEHGEIVMKRIVLAAAMLIAAGAAAQADTDHWTDVRSKVSRGDAVLNVEAENCRYQTGQQNYNGSPMLPAYLRCMRARGWRFDYTEVNRRHHHGWIDPETGLRCHSILGGFGSVCSNF
jgi:hypothetical protein